MHWYEAIKLVGALCFILLFLRACAAQWKDIVGFSKFVVRWWKRLRYPAANAQGSAATAETGSNRQVQNHDEENQIDQGADGGGIPLENLEQADKSEQGVQE